MSFRATLLSSTFLSGLLIGAAVAGETAPSTRAVDGVNAKVEGLGGAYATKGLYGVGGALSTPLGDQFGIQFDGTAANYANHFLGVVGGHLFWRDPQKALLGVTGDYLRWDQYGGVHVSHFGGEGEAYLGRWTLRGVAGVETGNNKMVTTGGTTASPITLGTIFTTTSTTTLANITRFYDRVSVDYYFTDNWRGSVGHRYTDGTHKLALGTEYALTGSRGMLATLFGEARIGEGSKNYGAWGGLRVYFGKTDKSLIRRHREDDPDSDFSGDSLFDIINSAGPGSSSSTSGQCQSGEVFQNGMCVSPSDRRLKRDIVLLARLDNGVGLYRYRYLWSDAVYVGVMAQEVAAIVPGAATMTADGYYRVDYARLGLRLLTWDEWLAQEATALAA